MSKIITKRRLNATVSLMEVEAPLIAKKARPGQFVIVRPDPQGERIPLTIADYDPLRGSVTIMFQRVGLTTQKLDELQEGGDLLDIVGPLGNPTETEGAKKAVVIGGGVGCAIAFPQAKALHRAGVPVDVIAGFRSKELVILEEEFGQNSDHLYITTDDGSYGEQGFVSQKLQSLLDSGAGYDLAIAIGPVPMMRSVAEVTRPLGIKTIVSLNPIMVDGTGMCGCCRVTVGGQTKFACVDGPDFDGHQVDYDELIRRNTVYREQEAKAMQDHTCRMERLAQAREKEE